MHPIHNASQSIKTDSQPATKTDASKNSAAPRVVSAGEWLRLKTNFQAPFGHDGMPTVWG